MVADNSSTVAVSNFGMSRVLAGHFPELTSADIHIVILTVERMHRQGRLQTMVTRKT